MSDGDARIYSIEFKSIRGEAMPFERFSGQVVLVVNTVAAAPWDADFLIAMETHNASHLTRHTVGLTCAEGPLRRTNANAVNRIALLALVAPECAAGLGVTPHAAGKMADPNY